MGPEEEAVARLVLDTNVLVSALLFRSEAAGLFDAWRRGGFRLVASAVILDEYRRVLEYPKFGLGREEAAAIIEQLVLPYCDLVEPRAFSRVCSDPDDDKFFHCAGAARATALVSGDRAVLALRPSHGRVRILTVAEACAEFSRPR